MNTSTATFYPMSVKRPFLLLSQMLWQDWQEGATQGVGSIKRITSPYTSNPYPFGTVIFRILALALTTGLVILIYFSGSFPFGGLSNPPFKVFI